MKKNLLFSNSFKQFIFIATFCIVNFVNAQTETVTINGSFTKFLQCGGITTSPIQTVTVSGANLTGPIEIRTSMGFSTSLNGTTFGTGYLSIPHTGGVVSPTTVYVRSSISSNSTASGFLHFDSNNVTRQSLVMNGESSSSVPGITATTNIAVSASATSFSIPYTGTSGLPTSYSVQDGANALPSFVAISNTSFSGNTGNLVVNIPANSNLGTYNFNLSVKNAAGCQSTVYPITLNIVPPPPTITSFSPTSGAVGSTVTITGTGFDSTSSNNVVRLNGMKCTVTNATSTTLTVAVPAGVESGKFQVTNLITKLIVYSNNKFFVNQNYSNQTIDSNAFSTIELASSIPTHTVNTTMNRFNLVDVDDDGDLDVSFYSANSTLNILTNNFVSGTLTASNFTLFEKTNNQAQWPNTTTSNGKTLPIDLDGDGKIDFVGSSNASTKGLANLNTTSSGNISFSDWREIRPGNTVNNYWAEHTLEAFDYNTDGKIDFIGTSRNGPGLFFLSENTSTNGVFSVTTGNLSNSYKQSFTENNAVPVVSDIVDVDQDGKPDYIYIDSSGLEIIRNTSADRASHNNFTFTWSVISTFSNGKSVVSADINSDQKPDLFVADGSIVRLFINNSSPGNILFSAPITVATLSGVGPLSIGDMDGDGKLDLVVSGTSTINFVRNITSSSTPSFNAPILIANHSSINDIKLVDLDKDGKIDVLAIKDAKLMFLRNRIGEIPLITTTGTLTAFTKCSGSASTAQTFTVSGSNLTANIDIAAVTGYEYSTDNATFSPTLSIPFGSGTVSATTIYVRMTAASTGTPSGTISISSTDATTQSVAVSGTVNALPTITLSAVPNATTLSTSFSIPYTAIANAPTLYSVVAGTNALPGFTTVVDASFSGSTGNLAVAIPANSTTGTYDFNVTVKNGTTGCVSSTYAKTVTITVPPPAITVSSSALSTITNCKTPLVIADHSVVNADVVVTATDLVYIDANGDPLLVYKNAANGNYYGSYLYTSGGGAISGASATSLNNFMATYSGAKVLALNFPSANPQITFNQTTGVVSGGITVLPYYENYSVSGAYLTAGLTITPTANFQVSTDQSTWIGTTTTPTAITLTPTSGIVASTTVYVRTTPSIAANTYSGTITMASTGATNQTKAVAATLYAATAITTQPLATKNICLNASTGNTINVAATGAGLTYQWYSNTTNSNTGGTSLGSTNGATSSTLTLSTASSGTIYYYCVVSGSCGAVTTAVSAVTINPASVAGTASASVTAMCSGNTTTLSLTGNTGTIQWQSSPNNSTWTNITGATAASYTTTALTATTYNRAVVTSGACTAATSNVVTITVTNIPVPTLATPSIQTFTAVGATNWTAPAGVNSVEYLVVGGGGGGGNGWDSTGGGGGGGGMVLTGKLSVAPGTTYPIVIGDGGDGGLSVRTTSNGSVGQNTEFASIKAFGGGKGYSARGSNSNTGLKQNLNCEAPFGGSGGTGGSAGKGGGGATTNGGNNSGTTPGTGGSGLTSSITGSSIVFSAGGAGGGTSTLTGTDGTINRGNGGRGGGAATSSSAAGGKGGSGIVVLKYTVQANAISYCQGTTALPLQAIAINGYTLQWYTVPTGGVASSTAPTPDTSVSATTTYYVSQKDNTSGCESDRIAIVVTVNSNPATPTVPNSVVNYCQGAVATPLAATALTGNTLQWYNGVTPLTYCAPTPSTTTAGTTTYNVTQFVDLTGCESTSTSITVNVYTAPVAGTATAASSTVCSGGTATITLANSTGNIQWQQLVGTTWTDIAGETSATLTTPAINQGTSFRAKVSGQYCSDVFSNTVIVGITSAQPFGNAMNLDGTNDYISIADNNALDFTSASNYTLEAWIYPKAFNWLGGIISKYNSNSANGYLLRSTHTGNNRGISFDEMVTADNILNVNTWYHIAAVKNGNVRKLYINGVEVALTGTAFTVQANNDPLLIGKDFLTDASQRFFNGDIDEVRIWNVARTLPEIQQAKDTPLVGNESGLVLYYDFNQGIPSGNNTSIATVNNITTNAMHGTITNMVKNGATSNFIVNSQGPYISGQPVCVGATTTFTHTISAGTWSSATTGVATIDPSTGVVTGVSAGTSVISYVYIYNGCTFTDTYTVTVNATPVAPVATTPVNVCQGTTATALTATATSGNTLQWYAAATGGTASTTATTPSRSVAGSTLYYVSQKNSTTACESPRTAITVNVNANPTLSGVQNMTVGGSTLQLTGSGTPDATTPWTSSNNTVATISATGEVTAVAGGSTTITYTTSSGCSVTAPLNVVDCTQPFGNALNFDGINDYLVLDNAGTNTSLQFANTTNYTLEAWVNRAATSTNDAVIISKQNGNVAGNYSLGISPAGIPYVSREYTPWAVSATASLPLNEWHHVAGVFDGSSLKIYIDGVLNNSVSASGSITPSTVTAIKVNIGSMYMNSTPSKFFNGSIDEARIWNVARTASQIQQSYKSELQGNESGLVGYYNFNQGTAGGSNSAVTSATNTVSSVSNGVLTNFTKSGTTSNFIQGFSALGITGAASVCSGTSQYTHPIAGGTWSVSNGAAATISAAGLLTTSSVENITLSYVYTLNGCSFTATKAIVIGAPSAPVVTATVNVCQGTTATALTATALTGHTLKWYTVATGGTASTTAPVPSTTTAGSILYYVSQVNSTTGCESPRATITAIIDPAPVVTGTGSVEVGSTITLTATTTPATNNAWVSSNTSVATVDNAGVVTAVATGSAVITFTNNTGCSATKNISVVVGTTQAPVLTHPASNLTGATTFRINYTLPEAPRSGSVRLTFVPVSGGSSVVWTMSNATTVDFNYTVTGQPNATYVTSGAALSYGTYNVTLSYQDVYSSPAATATATNIQTLAPPSIAFAQSSYTAFVGSSMTAITPTNTGGASSSYSINPSLPNGLTFNTTTGVISGTPTATEPQTNYTITATNAAGSDAKTIALLIDLDSDGDGVPNSVEVQQGTNPNVSGALDTDNDGVPDYVETQQGTNPTTPGALDTDNDGVPDYVEVQQGTSPTTPGARDTDNDGVPDYIEVQQGTNPNTSGDSIIDTDNDGVPDYVEVQQGTSPTTPGARDTDNDGVPDYVETQQGTSPTTPGARDTDNDGVPDYVEVQQGTNPATPGDTVIDTDNDGVPDYVEVQQGTNPTTPGDARDTDHDGVPDYVEVQQGTSPTTPGDSRDTDHDGVPDYVEVQQGTNPTTPGARDTDGDGVPDYVEVQQGTNPNTSGDSIIDTDGDGVPDYVEVQQGTNPTTPGARDTDGDGVPDYVELQQGTNPATPGDARDTDGDGVPNYVEVQQGTNPATPGDAIDTDGDGLSDYYESENGVPTNSTLSANSIAENNAVGAVIGNFTTVDLGDVYSHTYTLVSGVGSTDNASFTIVGNQLKAAIAFDYETKNSYSIRVKTTDAGGLSFEKVFTITINDVTEIPILSMATTNYVGFVSVPLSTITVVNTGGPVTLYTISPALPTGLVLNSLTGAITGTPRIGISTRTFTISGTNSNGTSSVSFSLFIDQDTDGDGLLDSVDTDDDGDSILDINDAFPTNRTEWKDTDRDGTGDNADTDDDNDGILDACDADVNGDRIPDNGTDMDSDGTIDGCDSDRDGDGVTNTSDNCPNTPNANQGDRDHDGQGDVCDTIELNVTQAITPNGDGINDTWVIYNLVNHPGSKVRVFNSNGVQVYYSSNYQNDWNGYYQGGSEMLPVGSYLYQIDLGGDGTIDSQGWIYLTK